MIEIEILPALTDNYIYLLRDDSGAVGVVDPGEVAPVVAMLERRGERLTHILCTHHHADHVGGVAELKGLYEAKVVGPYADRGRIPAIDEVYDEGETFRFGNAEVRCLFTPGHTLGHGAFWIPESNALFAGDTLFSVGCGRIFEGTMEQMWSSLLKLRDLPDDTRLYCGHEYTEANIRFALVVDPDNRELWRRRDEATAQRAQGVPTLPTRLGEEKEVNPFLRADRPELQRALGLEGADPVEVFAELRGRKDRF